MGRAKGEAESVLVAFFSYDINDFKKFLADFRQRNWSIFLPFLEASRYLSKHPIQSVRYCNKLFLMVRLKISILECEKNPNLAILH